MTPSVDTDPRIDEGASLGNTGIVHQDVDSAIQADDFFHYSIFGGGPV
jgi:hypothetical protein